MSKNLFYSLLIFLLCLFCFNQKAVAHSIQMGYCIDCNTGDITIWIEHNQGDGASSVGANLTLELSVNGVPQAPIVLVPTTTLVNIAGSGALPFCSTPITINGACAGWANTTNDWIGYTFSGLPVGVNIEITALSGGASMTLDWCGMFPASTGVFQKNCFALPIELLSFTGKNNDDVNELYWNTATEVNNNYFTIEKSQDGEIFELVDVISGAGNSSQEINYSLNDNNPYEGTSYYRLKQTDYDEKYSYSDIIAIKKENKTKLVIYPNPSNNAILISNFGKSLSSSSLKVYDTQGRLVLNRILEEETDYKLDISTLVNGLYFIKMINNQNTFTESFIKE